MDGGGDGAGRDRWFKFLFNILSLVSERCFFRPTETDKQTDKERGTGRDRDRNTYPQHSK